MAQITLDIPQHVIDSINNDLRKINYRHDESPALSANDIGKEALAIYKWAVEQIHDGYAIVSMNKNKEPITQICTPQLPAKPPTRY